MARGLLHEVVGNGMVVGGRGLITNSDDGMNPARSSNATSVGRPSIP